MKYLCVISIMFLMLLLTGYVAKADVYYPPTDEVHNYYKYINNGQLEYAYKCRSAVYTSEYSYEYFCNNWSNNLSIEIVKMWAISDPGSSAGDGEKAVIGIRVYSTDYDSNGNPHSAYYSGEAYLTFRATRMGCEWEIDEIVLVKE